MASGSGYSLVSNSAAVGASAAVGISSGGRFVIVSSATTYPGTSCQVQVQGKSGNWFSFGSAITVDAVSAGLDLPGGQYRLLTSGTAPAGLYVDLVRIAY